MLSCMCIPYNAHFPIRLGGGSDDYKDVKGHTFFSSINFDDLMDKKVSKHDLSDGHYTHRYSSLNLCVCALIQIEPPFKPDVTDDTDVSNFDTDFTSEDPTLTPPDDSEFTGSACPIVYVIPLLYCNSCRFV